MDGLSAIGRGSSLDEGSAPSSSGTCPRRPDDSASRAERSIGSWARQRGEPGLVSVVIPVFNGAEFLTDALESVRAQSHARWEAVVVDDGSTDQSLEVARALAQRDSRILVIAQANAGPSAARNRGLLECRGELVQFLDADDRLCPHKLDLQLT